jgi:hypothetical protein
MMSASPAAGGECEAQADGAADQCDKGDVLHLT